MAKSDKGIAITKELQETVRRNPLLKEVHFDENGNHSFMKHTIKVHKTDDQGFSKGVKEVEAMPGAKKNIVKIIGNNKVMKEHFVNTEYTPVAATLTREEILSANAVGKSLSEKEKIEILAKAAEISKGADFDSLIAKINGGKSKGKGKEEVSNQE